MVVVEANPLVGKRPPVDAVKAGKKPRSPAEKRTVQDPRPGGFPNCQTGPPEGIDGFEDDRRAGGRGQDHRRRQGDDKPHGSPDAPSAVE